MKIDFKLKISVVMALLLISFGCGGKSQPGMIDTRDPEVVLYSIRAECAYRLRRVFECRQRLQSRGELSLYTLRECAPAYSFSIPRAGSPSTLSSSQADLPGEVIGDYVIYPSFFAQDYSDTSGGIILESQPHRVVHNGVSAFEVIVRMREDGEIEIEFEKV